MEKDKSLIPKGLYCYGRDESGKRVNCPYWECRDDKPEQANGYCNFLEKGDWDLNKEYGKEVKITEFVDGKPVTHIAHDVDDFPMSHLWDQCKECGINDGIEDDGL